LPASSVKISGLNFLWKTKSDSRLYVNWAGILIRVILKIKTIFILTR
jgi:hypothetical protein